MKQSFEVHNEKCGTCAHSLIMALKDMFSDLDVDLESMLRKFNLELHDSQMDALHRKLKSAGYPLQHENLSTLEKVGRTAMSFVFCAVGRIENR